MLELYYRIWVDCIKRGKLRPENRQNWKFKSMVFMTLSMTANLILLMTILQKHILGYYFYKLNIHYFAANVNNVLSFLILFISPCILINYLLIFQSDRYKRLQEKYPYYEGKLFLVYFLVSMLMPILLLWIGIIFFR
jgi:hypothetical protein